TGRGWRSTGASRVARTTTRWMLRRRRSTSWRGLRRSRRRGSRRRPAPPGEAPRWLSGPAAGSWPEHASAPAAGGGPPGPTRPTSRSVLLLVQVLGAEHRGRPVQRHHLVGHVDALGRHVAVAGPVDVAAQLDAVAVRDEENRHRLGAVDPG